MRLCPGSSSCRAEPRKRSTADEQAMESTGEREDGMPEAEEMVEGVAMEVETVMVAMDNP